MAANANRLREELPEEEQSSPKEKEKKISKKVAKGFKGKMDVVRNFLADERTHKTGGLFLLLSSFYLLIAFTSNFFSWKEDEAVAGVSSTWDLLTTNSIHVENWLGKIGAITALQFMNNWFGVASFVFPLLIFLAGVRIIFEATLLPFGKTIRYSLFTLIWLPTFLAFIFHSSSMLVLGGAYGYHISQTLNGVVGFIGTGALLVFSFVGFLVVAFNISFVKQLREEKEIVAEEELSIESINENIELRNAMRPNEAPNMFVLSPEANEKEEEQPEVIAEQEESLELEVEQESEEEEIEAGEAVLFEIDENGIPMEIEESAIEEVAELTEEGALPHAQGDYDPTLDLSEYQYPTLDLLENYDDSKVEINREELEANKNRIVQTLQQFGIGITKIKATIGPTVTLFEIVPDAGVRISKIKNLEDDIALSLSALGIRIIAPIPGKGTIGIEVPNQKPEIVPMKTILSSEKFVNSEFDLPIGLGKTISNEVFVADLAKMPHLLMAGSTGQGKSVGLNAVLVSLLYKKHPAQVKFVLVDPKKVELTIFKSIERHFLAKLPGEANAIITDTKKVVHTLNSLCIEMDERYKLLEDAAVRNIKEYNAKFIARKLNPNNGHKFLPYIILVVDEFADLIMTAGKEIETPITRLAQLARAIGIHLIIATQRPSVNIITGSIKANFPARIAFRVISKIDSRTILDAGGADQLVGRGDMLLSTGADMIRLQCAFVDTHEVERITEFIGSQRGYSDAHMLPEYVDENAEAMKSEMNPNERDQYFKEAAQLVVQFQQGSASLIQRRLKLGYNRAGRLIDQLEAAGIVGPFEGSKARQVLIKDLNTLDQMLADPPDTAV